MFRIRRFDLKGMFSDFKLLRLPCLLFTLSVLLPVNPLKPKLISVTSFNRVFGISTLSNVDSTKRAMLLLIFSVVLVPLCILFSFMVCKLLANTQALRKNPTLQKWINCVSLCGLASMSLLFVGKYSEEMSTVLNLALAPCIAVVFVALGLIFTRLYREPDENKTNDFKFICSFSFALSLICSFLFQINTPINGLKGLVYNYRIIFIFFLIGVVATYLFSKINKPIDRFKTASTPVFFSMYAVALFLELTNILNQHSVFIVRRLFFAKLLALALVALSLILLLFKFKGSKRLDTIHAIGLILGLCVFAILPSFKVTAGTDLFEQGNHGMLVYDFINYGKIPILESFDGHMLKLSFGGIFFSLFNGMSVVDGSYFQYNLWQPIITLMLYFLIKKTFDKDFAFFAVMLVPLPFIDFYLLALLCFLYAIKKRTGLSWFIYFLSAALTAFYDLPTAVAVCGGTLFLAILLLISEAIKERKITVSLKRFFMSGVIFTLCFASVYLLLCLIKNINSLTRMLEFINLIASNNNWAFPTIGNKESLLFSLCYSLLPFLAICLLLFCFYKIFIKKQTNTPLLITAALLLAYFFNFPRMFGRHSLAENAWSLAIMFFAVSLLFIWAAIKPNIKMQSFVAVAVAIPFIFSGIANQKTTFQQSLLQKFLVSYTGTRHYFNGVEEKVNRVNYEKVRTAHQSVLDMIDTVMRSDETYMDLTSQSMLYALSGKEKPVYVNQTPLQLSGEFTQEQYINEVKRYGDKCAYALLQNKDWNKLDGIENALRYYKVYEYLYENFVPLCAEDEEGYSIWVLRDKYDEAKARLPLKKSVQVSTSHSKLNNDNWADGVSKTNNLLILLENPKGIDNILSLKADDEAIEFTHITTDNDYIYVQAVDTETANRLINASDITLTGEFTPFRSIDYDDITINHHHKYGLLAYIWGEYDSKEAYNNPTVKTLNPVDTIQKSQQSYSNYILINAFADEDGNGILNFTTRSGQEFSYNFTIKAGSHRYLIRVSTDSYWAKEDLTLKLEASDSIKINEISLLQGD